MNEKQVTLLLGMAAARIEELEQQRDDLDRRCTEYALQCNRYASLNAELLEALMNLSAVARHYLPDYDEHQEIKNAETAIAKSRWKHD